MNLNLIVNKSKKIGHLFVQKSFRSHSGKTTAKIIERLGFIEELIARFGQKAPVGSARKYASFRKPRPTRHERRSSLE